MGKAAHRNLLLGWRDFLDTPITEVHMKAAVNKGARNKAPGRDIIYLGFYKFDWDSIKNDMLAPCNQTYLDDRIIERQKHGFVSSKPKTDTPNASVDYGPISLVNTDYKIAARIVANRIRSSISDMLQPSQRCRVPDNTICDAVTSVRDARAYAEFTHAPLCALTLDLTAAFDMISRTSLLLMLKIMTMA